MILLDLSKVVLTFILTLITYFLKIEHMNIIDHTYLVDQLNENILDLMQIQKNLTNKHCSLPHLQLLKQKIAMKILHFKSAITQIQQKQHSQATLNQLNNYFSNNFSQIVKEAHRLLQVRPGQTGHQRLQGKLSMIRQMEVEMGQQWQKKKSTKDNGLLKVISNNISMLSQQVDQTKLRSIAKDYLHKQFLAIRMIAYKLYEQYTNHSHNSFKQQLQDIKKQQQQLLMSVQQLSQLNKELKGQQKRMIRQLNEIKRINDMISKRYFVSRLSSPIKDK